MLDSSMLSINFETPEASDKPETVSFSFFKTGQKKAFYETSFKYTMNTKDSHPFSISRIPVSLLSGTYFLRISGMDEHRKLLYSSAVTKIIVKNGCISPAAITLHKKQYARLFACFSGDNLPESEVSFDLFQKTEENYFYLDTVSSSGFTKKFSDLYTADLSFSCLLPLETYLFQPTEAHFRSSSFLIAKISSENLYPTEDAALSASPFLQCSCIYTKNEKTEYPSDFSDHKIHILPEIDILITKEQIRTDSSYPNSVIAIYKKDGTPISTTLSPKLDKNTVFKESPDTIIDIYTNHELLMTNQSSYQ